ncbi:MAG: gamma-glutamylputrescine oxidase PuuB [Roseibaca calidilacus]|uniref:Gamma-glutamylputrescine oxidase n=1 Tax=Roseibaca calidilacus TaxID=1666912 RepID=A0A0N8K7F4_9RHOB|nr:FAD-binding oxidoreductase [Roseibaca calidilacus]KPP91585.1 MAG: gamma-glutamylputrescine oxidase PuuB [Roseibaca calidilacus]CUX82872.1 gamma-glutamylputrescine oxidase [Roseibaca calidilacus]
MNLLFANDRAGQYPPSYYAETATPLPLQASLRGAVQADVCIIGGGYTGLSAALHLAQRGYSVRLLEAHRVGFGASGRNGGQIGPGQRIEQDAIERMVGHEDARALWQMGLDARDLVHELIAHHGIDSPISPGVIHADWQASGARHSHAYAEKLARDYGYTDIEALDRAQIQQIVQSPAYQGGILDHGAGHLHPLRYALGLARAALAAGAVIHENALVVAIEPGAKPIIRTQSGHVQADHVILAANGYLGGLVPQVAARVMPINNFIIATEPLPEGTVLTRNHAVADSKFVINYFRLSQDNRLLFGGGESYGYRFPDILRTVRKPMLQVFPQLADTRITHAWGGTLAITMTRLPCFRRVAPNILSASGYSGHGVALATLAGRIMAETVAGQSERFDLVARLPLPAFPGGRALRNPLLALAMTWFSLRDRLGI